MNATVERSAPSGAATRALFRLAVRNGRRNIGRSLLIVALLAVPIAAAIVVAAGQRALFATPEQQTEWQFGQSDAVVQTALGAIPFRSSGTTVEARDLAGSMGLSEAQARQLIDWAATTDVTFLEDVLRQVAPDGQVAVSAQTGSNLGQNYLPIRGLDPTLALTQGIVSLAEGAWPTTLDEVTLTAPAARFLSASPGDKVTIQPLGEKTVTGIHKIRSDANGFGVVALPDALPDGSATDYLIGGLPDGFDLRGNLATALTNAVGPDVTETLLNTGAVYAAPTDSYFGAGEGAPLQIDRPPVLAGFVAAALLVEVGLVAAAAYATGTRRRLREFGLLATIGADPSHIRRLVLLEAAVLGLASAVLGCVAGVVSAKVFQGPISGLSEHVVDNVSARWSDVFVPAVVGLVAALLAAWWPARTIARVPVLTALAGRMPLRPLTFRAVPTAVTLLTLGLVILGLGSATARYDRELSDAIIGAMLFGCLLCLAGAAMAGTWFIGRISAAGSRLPLTMRLVARDAGRQQFRSAVAVAGLVVVLAAPVALAAAVVTAEADSRASFVPAALEDEVLITPVVGGGDEGRSASDDAVRAVERVAPGQVTGSFQRLGILTDAVDGAFSQDGTTYAQPVWAQPEDLRLDGATIALGTPEAVRALRLPEQTQALLDEGHIVALAGRGGAFQIQIPTADAMSYIPATAVAVGDRPHSWNTPTHLMPIAVADELGLIVFDETTVFATDAPISTSQRDAIWDIGREPGQDIGEVSFAVGQPFDGFSVRVQAIALPVALAVVLIVGGSLVAIAATESDRDIATMRRVGAAPSLRRRFLGVQGWYHAALAAFLAVPVGLLMLVALRRALLDPPPLVIPWASVLGVLVVIPIVLGVVIAVSVRSLAPEAVRPSVER